MNLVFSKGGAFAQMECELCKNWLLYLTGPVFFCKTCDIAYCKSCADKRKDQDQNAGTGGTDESPE